jgi:hypothetical protein
VTAPIVTAPFVTAPIRAAVSVDELRRAWRAVVAGEFRGTPAGRAVRSARPGLGEAARWRPVEPVVAVLGCAGSVGASTVALVIAAAAAGGVGTARVVECCPAVASGLAAAATVELAVDAAGWRRGGRDGVLIERSVTAATDVAEVAVPATGSDDVRACVVDVGWPLQQVRAAGTWLSTAVSDASAVVVVAAATVPGMRRLESTLAVLAAPTGGVHGPRPAVLAAVVGPVRARWPGPVTVAAGAQLRALERADRLFTVPHDRGLAVRGLDEQPLPGSVLQAGTDLWALISGSRPTPTSRSAVGSPSRRRHR